VIVLSTVLRIKRTLDGAEIDEIISGLQAAKALAIERHRRMQWDRTVKSAAAFKPGCWTKEPTANNGISSRLHY
jgi:hypothetical protein